MSAEQLKGEQLIQGHYAVATVRFEPATLRLCVKNPTATLLLLLLHIGVVVMIDIL